MSFTKEDFADIRNFYEAYFESYQHGDTEKMAVFLDDELKLTGGTEQKNLQNKKEPAEYLKASGTEITHGVEFRNRRVNITPVFPVAMITELNDLYIQIKGEWTFCGHVRNTVMVQKKAGQWKVIQQESSLPDTRTSGNEIFAFEKIREENLLLREAVERSAAELEHKNRELEIEAALESVRSMAMDMREPADMLGVCRCIASQLELLNVKSIRNVQTANFVEEKNIYLNYQYYPLHDLDIVDEVDYRVHPVQVDFARQMMKGQGEFFTHHFEGEDLKVWFETQKKSYQFVDHFLDNAQTLDYYFFSLKDVALGISTYSSLNENEIQLFKRFRNVFELAYRRFADIRSAESQAREAKVEAALEKVRAKTMAIHNSEEVGGTVCALFDELIKLGVKTHRSGIAIFKTDPLFEIWTVKSEVGKKSTLVTGQLDMSIHPMLAAVLEAWKDKKAHFAYELAGNSLRAYYEAINAYAGYPAKFNLGDLPEKETLNEFYFNEGALFAFTTEQLSEEAINVCKRFAALFGQTYRRYLDLQKAEAQTKEAQIEAALERVRSQSMAMHTSSDLQEVIRVVNEQLLTIGIKFDHVTFVKRYDDRSWDLWIATPGQRYSAQVHMPFIDTLIFREVDEIYSRGLDFFSNVYGQEEKNAFFRHFFEQPSARNIPEERKQYVLSRKGMARSAFLTKIIWFNIANYDAIPYTDEENAILKRFAYVFEQSYTRFLDLQKAEAQARESQIEASLERVRSKAVTMHSSSDLNMAVATVFEELDKLNLGMLRCGIGILDKEKRTGEIFSTVRTEDGLDVQVSGDESMNIHPLLKGAFEAWLKKEDFAYRLEGADLEEYYHAVSGGNFKLPEAQGMVAEKTVQSHDYFMAAFDAGGLYAFRDQPFGEEAKAVLKRFANVFNLTYKRFLDLLKAEAQTREAVIEASLEKVRGMAMAMRNSEDLSSTASMVFTELRKLGIRPIRCGVGLLHKETTKTQLYASTSSPDGDQLGLIGWVMLEGHPVLAKVYESWLTNEDFFPELCGEELNTYYKQLLSGLSIPAPTDWKMEETQYGHFFPFSVGMFYAWADRKYTNAEIKIFKRFAAIIDLTFRRYTELKASEASAREAVRRASLDRIRAEIASMRTVTDLEKITPVIWNELTVLGIPFTRCGVFIMDEDKEQMHSFLSTPDGKALAAFHLPYDAPGNIPAIVDHWRDKKIFIDHWDEAAFSEWTSNLVERGLIPKEDSYLSNLPHGLLHLYFLPFLQGMLYVGNHEELKESDINLVQSVAESFSTAYARYEDFNRLEQAKQQVDKTLLELKQAQTQLIQSEKMASLGELTAGIAHEIQNPLNFVNNFSEIGNELIQEINEEISRGEYQLAAQIAEDLRQNLEKINLHGKRADGIVKSMLQHSRTSGNVKDPTDLNALCDEYLRLSYHGLRAKDKLFNAQLETVFDESVGRVEVIAQDISRVLLNLFNNAFYAVMERKKKAPPDYQPKVTVTTKKNEGNVVITVRDNGTGIPARIKEKIFQPFFTTKPSGQGTGLGLSLSYDIITQGHGGSFEFESTVGEGSTFSIIIPN